MQEISTKKTSKALITASILLILSIFVMIITFLFSTANLNIELFKSYFANFELILLNLAPILIFMILIYMISNRVWLSFLLTNLLFVTASLVNKFKLGFRDDPLTFIDVKLFSESIAMTKRYDIKFTPRIILVLLSIVIITILLKKFFKCKINSRKTRLSLLFTIILISTITFKDLYFDFDRYEKLGDDSLINIWSEPQQFQSKGFVYPFLHSIVYAKDNTLEGYDEEKAKKDLNSYTYSNIPKDKKVNVIGIMLEAFNDFSKFEDIEIDEEVYRDFHKVQENSLHGNLVTNVFGGGTINTERGFLTGYQNHPKYLQNTNSFVWYFKEQGYNTKAMHPFHGWFYNRRNINEYIGFDSFDYYENKYEKDDEEILMDMEFFDYIIEDYEKSRDENKPYFNFSVTYQNHGPYSGGVETDKEYLKRKPEYVENEYNLINNYLRGISETSSAIKKLTDYFEDEEEPVIVVMFGDHNPWLGEENIGYDMLGIDLDFSNEQGFLNYYQTPYIVWGNEVAKKEFDKDFNEESEDLSPNFLMPKIFEYLGLEGNQYMKYLMDLKETIDVNHKVLYKENGKYTKKLSTVNEEKYKDFMNLEFYYRRNFIENK